MARRKSHHKRKHTTRRKRHTMSGVGATMSNILPIVAGAVAGRVLTSKLSSKFNPKILAGGQIAVGLFLPKFVKNKFVSGFAEGMLINGAVSGLQSFGVIGAIAGIGETEDVQMEISGSSSINEIAGTEESYDTMDGITDYGTMSGGSSDISILSGGSGDQDWDTDY